MFASITPEAIQRWVRIGLYYVWGFLGAWGATDMGQNVKLMVASALGFVATAAWTKYGSRLSAMLSEVEKTAGVEKLTVTVDPTKVNPTQLAKETPDAVTVKAP